MIKTVMTPFPYSVDIGTLIGEARDYMEQHGIHHLPVTDGERIAGILGKKDLQVEENLTVGEMSFSKPRVFDLNERLDNILQIMADQHINTVLVMRNNKLVGIYTVTDACRQYAEYLREEFGPHGGNDAA